METENSPLTSAKAPPLNSDQLNYLIWRYLQESGYGDAAVKLQRDWNVNAEALPFATHIQGQALIKLVQKGLKYHHLQLTIDENGRSTRQLTPAMFFFGPESEKQTPEPREPAQRPTSSHRAPSPETSLIVPQKRPGETGPNSVSEGTPQPALKRNKKTAKEPVSDRNGTIPRKPSATTPGAQPNGMDTDTVNGHAPSVQDARSPSTGPKVDDEQLDTNGVRPDDQMDVDTDGDRVATFSEAVSPLIPTLAHGESVGIQVAPAKVADLGPSTTYLSVPDHNHLSQSAWKPQSQHIISARGDTVCGLWQTQQTPAAFRDLVLPRNVDRQLVTAMAWEPTGTILAVATCTPDGGHLHLYDGDDFGLLETLPAAQRAILKLKWHQAGMRLIGLAPFDEKNEASSILLWDLSGNEAGPGPLSQPVPETLEDLDCALADAHGYAVATGGEAVYQCRAFSELEVEQKYSSFPSGNDRWSFIKCSWRTPTDTLLVAASSETGRFWLPDRDLKQDAHQAAITGLQIRPQLAGGISTLSTSEFATSSEDGTIKVWHYDRQSNRLNQLSKLSLGFPHLLKTLSYSPDGFCLAGASYGIVRIWNAEHGYNQMANWLSDETIWRGNTMKDDDLVSNGAVSSINGDNAISSVDHSLSWDSDSKRLAFALGSQVALINFQR